MFRCRHAWTSDELTEVLAGATGCLEHPHVVRPPSGGRNSGTIDGVATRKVTLSIDHTAWALAEAAAARAGMSPSAWLSAAARREAIRLGAGTEWGDWEAEALTQDADLAKAEEDLRAAR